MLHSAGPEGDGHKTWYWCINKAHIGNYNYDAWRYASSSAFMGASNYNALRSSQSIINVITNSLTTSAGSDAGGIHNSNVCRYGNHKWNYLKAFGQLSGSSHYYRHYSPSILKCIM